MLIANFSRKGEEIEINEELWQWDYGQKIQITGLDLPEIFEVHFSWKDLETAKVVTGTTVDGISTVDIPNAALRQKRMITAYIYISNPEGGETANVIYMMVNSRKAPEGFETPEDVDLFHHTLAAAAEYQRRTEKAKNQAEAKAEEAESWAHGHEKHPDRDKDNAKYYADQAAGAVEEVSGRTSKAKEEIDNYVKQKETELKGDTGNVFFAAFRVVAGRLIMRSDPKVDKVHFYREGSRLKYRVKFERRRNERGRK